MGPRAPPEFWDPLAGWVQQGTKGFVAQRALQATQDPLEPRGSLDRLDSPVQLEVRVGKEIQGP